MGLLFRRTSGGEKLRFFLIFPLDLFLKLIFNFSHEQNNF